ncbi:Retrotransposon gag protein [Corchorus capsularis]|uniref:Retrotransposon gag protein n=1 Tax=Corchorus capsularis TaxID=210143 RepID=A0A1R3IZG6_COCAP|nr:Retrotransposon gag protein [Corchorus capsularis]
MSEKDTIEARERRIRAIQKEILSIRQRYHEEWFDYWDRFNWACKFFVDHGLPEGQLIKSFIVGLSQSDRTLIDAINKRSLELESPEDARRLLSTLAEGEFQRKRQRYVRKQLELCKQLPDKEAHHFWDRLNQIWCQPPTHGLHEKELLNRFYSGMQNNGQRQIDDACGDIPPWMKGGFFSKGCAKKRKLVKQILIKSKKFSTKVTQWHQAPEIETTLSKDKPVHSKTSEIDGFHDVAEVPTGIEPQESSETINDPHELDLQDSSQSLPKEGDDEPYEVCVPTLPKEVPKVVPEKSEAPKEDIKMDILSPSPTSLAKQEVEPPEDEPPEDEPPEDEQLGYPKLKELSVLNFVDNQPLKHEDRNFLGINKLLKSYYIEEINMDQFFLEDKKICQHEDTIQRRDENNANEECRKHPLHQPLTATKMALSFLAIHGVALNKIARAPSQASTVPLARSCQVATEPPVPHTRPCPANVVAARAMPGFIRSNRTPCPVSAGHSYFLPSHHRTKSGHVCALSSYIRCTSAPSQVRTDQYLAKDAQCRVISGYHRAITSHIRATTGMHTSANAAK